MNDVHVEAENEGFLIVTVVGERNQIEKNGTVCNLNWHSASLFCRSFGFMFADWESRPNEMLHITEYVFAIYKPLIHNYQASIHNLTCTSIQVNVNKGIFITVTRSTWQARRRFPLLIIF